MTPGVRLASGAVRQAETPALPRSGWLVAVLILGAAAQLGAQQAAKKGPNKPARAPDVANASYGPHERNVLDLWKAKSSRPAPLVIHIHGGGFTQGDKSGISAVLLEGCLREGFSVASINYRYSTIAPYPAPMADSARAVQFLRLHAAEWNLDPKAFGATGGSAGAGISLWIGFHDDMAEPKSSDPLKRQSTRLSAMAVTNGQTTYDPRTIHSLIDPTTARIGALRTLFNVKQEDPLQDREAFKRYEEGSAVTHLTKDDPPVLLQYSRGNTPMPPENTGIGIHHPRFGYFLKEKMDKLGIECVVKTADDYTGKPAGQQQRDIVEFFKQHFPGK
ncbi:MAG TPA: alpha/beta hydrolase [Bryobacteraceae bacterium]|nr:alpha/beta hydrolase [Bryobacteraceae bacterium]